MPTIDEDLAVVSAAMCSPDTEQWRALTRIRAALADMGHLEEARFVLWCMLNPTEHPMQPSNWRPQNWFEAERLRQSGKGGA